MNYMNTMDLEARELLNDNAVVSRILLQDEGEIIIIEGKHVAVDKNNNRVNGALITTLQYGWSANTLKLLCSPTTIRCSLNG